MARTGAEAYAALTSSAAARPRRSRRLARAGRRTSAFVSRRLVTSDAFALAVLFAVAVAVGLVFVDRPDLVPATSLVLVVLCGGLLLSVRSLLLLYVVCVAVLVSMVLRTTDAVRPGSVVVIVVTGLIVLLLTRSRARLGVLGTRGESMLVDLRDRLRAQGEMPALPEGWEAEVQLRSANGASFSGDFIVASRSPDGAALELAVVDVSGKGVDAGTRALLLSGAFGGLLGAMPPEEFLEAANAYLIRQDWDEGFATAAHVVIDLSTGAYRVASAGHPPTAQFHAGSGRWAVTELTEGPLLGIIPDGVFVGQTGSLRRGDALLLYTDGLVEVPGRDLADGIDRLLGEAERLITKGFRHGARRLVDRVVTGENDDRALVLLWRT